MPSLSAYSRELRSEGMCDYAAVAKTGERMASLNDSQLKGMKLYLEHTDLRAEEGTYKWGLGEVLREVNVEYAKREGHWKLQAKVKADRALHEAKAIKKQNIQESEFRAVRDMITTHAMRTAELEVREMEDERRLLEKTALTKQLVLGEATRNKLWSVAAATALIAIVRRALSCVFITCRAARAARAACWHVVCVSPPIARCGSPPPGAHNDDGGISSGGRSPERERDLLVPLANASNGFRGRSRQRLSRLGVLGGVGHISACRGAPIVFAVGSR